MDLDILIPLLAIFSTILVPVVGLMIILTTRFALKPLVETLARALRESGYGTSPELTTQMHALAEQVEALTTEVHHLREAQEFDRKLLDSGGKSEKTPG